MGCLFAKAIPASPSNKLGRCCSPTKPLFYDSYKRNRATGSLILIDKFTNETVGAGMITILCVRRTCAANCRRAVGYGRNYKLLKLNCPKAKHYMILTQQAKLLSIELFLWETGDGRAEFLIYFLKTTLQLNSKTIYNN